jgi:putative SOS response-associated peptidase YedK
MCNLYRLAQPLDEVMAYFSVSSDARDLNISDAVYPGHSGAVIASGKLRQMIWGFPLQLKGKHGQPLKPKPVNNTRADKFGSNFWYNSFEQRRCLIPLTAWAEAEGPTGAKTRTWLSLPDYPIFACAGIWRNTDAWGQVYSIVMTDAAGAAAECHTRMPVILKPELWSVWQSGDADRAKQLCVPYDGEVVLDRTLEPWVRKAG